jgi:carbonic anhydrase
MLTGAGLAARPRRRALAAPAPEGRDPDQVLRALLEGNERFASGRTQGPRRGPEDFASLAAGQSPAAVILGCADSRVPPELVFDQGVGDLFVVRVAGNVVSEPGFKVKGSIEYAVAELGASLVLVLGHTGCGAIKAAIAHIAERDALPGSIKPLVAALRPAVVRAKGQPGDLLANAIRANVALGVEFLRTLPPILAPAAKQGRLKVAGGVYDLATGRVALLG